jgi:glycosyltransferase involved in cell wall biosynthesis
LRLEVRSETVTGKKPLVVHVITRLIVGGAQLSVIGLCEALRPHYDVRLLSGPEEGPEGSLRARASEAVQLTIVPALRRDVDLRHDVAAVIALRRAFRELKPAIVHTHSSKAGVLGRLAAVRDVPSIVHTVHGWGHTPADSHLRRAAFVGAERVVARWTDALVAVSPDVRDEGLRRKIGGPHLYEVIPEFVDYRPQSSDFAASRRRAREALGLQESDEVVGWVGRFVPQKDPETLVGALKLILNARTKARAVLVGDGPLREHIVDLSRANGLGERVLFTGLREDARQLYAAFDVLLHPSRWEGQPRVIQEAIAERVPVVASRVAGASELVVDGRNGYLTAPGDAKTMAVRTLEVLDDPRVRAPLADDAVAEIAELYGHESALRAHLDLYARLLAPGSSGR